MFDRIIHFSLNNRLLVVFASIALALAGGYTAFRLNLDVFPDLNAPTVTVLTEAHGMAPEEVEALVTLPLESAFNGSTGVRRIRSFSSPGFSVVHAEFDWSMNIFHARQIVSEKLQSVSALLPKEITPPVMAPISSIMGEVMLLGLQVEQGKENNVSMMELRTIADWEIRRRLLSIPGVAQVYPIGGEVKEYQVHVLPDRLQSFGLSLEDIVSCATEASLTSSGGVLRSKGKEYPIRGLGQATDIEQLEKAVVQHRPEGSVLLGDLANVEIGPAVSFGTASADGKPSVVLSITKQPGANTLKLTKKIEEAIEEMSSRLPPGIEFQKEFFRQADFIEVALENILHALRDGALLVLVVLFLFLGNFRITFISILAIPLSLSVTFLVFQLSGVELNTMTLGGIGIAIGALVDDAIIDVENVFRRLRENAQLEQGKQLPVREVVFQASKEIRKPMVGATLIITLVFFPLFFLSGVEGRLLQPMGFSYVISILASLMIALTVTPVLASLLLPNFVNNKQLKDGYLVRWLKPAYAKALTFSLNRPMFAILLSGILFVSALFLIPGLGRSFLPEFNEGALTVSYVTAPDLSLNESDKVGQRVELALLGNDGVSSVQRRTGRAELDEHSQPVNAGEIEVVLDLSQVSREVAMEQARESLHTIPGAQFTVGQPISHRIDHMLSGTRASIAVKIFGSDLDQLRKLAEIAESEMKSVKGVVDLAIEPIIKTAQISFHYDREAMSLHGLSTADLSQFIEVAFKGETVGRIMEGRRSFDLVVRYEKSNRSSIEDLKNAMIKTSNGVFIPLSEVTKLELIPGPNQVSRENSQRKLVVQANVAGRDLVGVVDEVRNLLKTKIRLPKNYYIEYGGQFESEVEASRTIWTLSILSFLFIAVILYQEFKSAKDVLFVLVNLPLALIGGVWSVWLTDGIVSIASLVGFITLFGIASRNGILLISHFHNLITEGKTLKEAVKQGSIERLNPILMTALTAAFALIPLALGLGQPGKEIEAPMAIVILGGLITSTFLNMILIPTLYLRFSSVSSSRKY